MTEQSKPNRRRFRRRTIRTLVEYNSDAGPRYENATTLGAGGLFIETDSPAPEGVRLKLRFQVSEHGDFHEIEGRVAWSKAVAPGAVGVPGMGIEFTDRASIDALAFELEALD